MPVSKQAGKNATFVPATHAVASFVDLEAQQAESKALVPTTSTEAHSSSSSSSSASSSASQHFSPPTYDYPPEGGCLPCCCYRRRIGNVYVLWEEQLPNGLLKIKCVAPVCWPMMFVSIGIICSISYFALSFSLPQLPWFFTPLSLFFVASFVVSIMLTSLRDFGIFPRYHEKRGPHWNWSVQSQSFRPGGVIFCSESKVLVKGIDHFCPWTGTTIASGNMISFYCLLTSFWTVIITDIALAVYTIFFIDRS